NGRGERARRWPRPRRTRWRGASGVRARSERERPERERAERERAERERAKREQPQRERAERELAERESVVGLAEPAQPGLAAEGRVRRAAQERALAGTAPPARA